MSAKEMVKPSPKRRVVDHLKATYRVSERRACALVRQARSVYHYRSRRDPRTEIRARMREIAAARVRYGYRKIRVMLQREGFELSKKVVYRLYREEELSPVAAADAGDACDPIAGQKGAGHHNSHRSGRSAINALSPSPFEPPSGPTGATE